MKPAERMELLAPAGSEESLLAAVRCGADAVYLGGKHLNARRGAANFDAPALERAVSCCHVRGVKVYLTLNTVVFDDEWEDVRAALRDACAAGVDAVLVQDLAIAAAVREAAPDIALHASTQMSIHSLEGAKQLESLGFSRVVLARELSAGEIAEIAAGASLEVECFVHGALCMSVSGQCYLSSIIGGRSGNRGLCAQPCRLPFSCGDLSEALSLKDVSLISRLGELAEAGVRALKIEGRMKRPEYVAAAVTACRQALKGEAPDFEALRAVFSRSGFTDGYFAGRVDGEMFGTRQKEDVTAASASVLKGLSRLYKDERQSVPVDLYFELQRDAPALLAAGDDDGNRAEIRGEVPQRAVTSPTDEAKAAASLRKTGGTPYIVREVRSKIVEGLMLPASALNALRRAALDELTILRGRPRPRRFHEDALPRPLPGHIPARAPEMRVRLGRAGQLTEELAGMADAVLLPAGEWDRADSALTARLAGRLLVEIPRLVFGSERESQLEKVLERIYRSGVRGAVAGGLAGVRLARRMGFAVHGDYSLNITNTVALEEYGRLGLRDATVSFELALRRIGRLGGALPRGMLAYGHLPLMALRNCPVSAQRGCAACGRSFPELTDRLGNRFFLDCGWQAATLYNHLPLNLADRMRELRGVDFLTLYFTRESPEECIEILSAYRRGMGSERPKTRGLYYREVF